MSHGGGSVLPSSVRLCTWLRLWMRSLFKKHGLESLVVCCKIQAKAFATAAGTAAFSPGVPPSGCLPRKAVERDLADADFLSSRFLSLLHKALQLVFRSSLETACRNNGKDFSLFQVQSRTFGILTQIRNASERNHEDSAPGRRNATSKSPLGDIAVASLTSTIAARGSVSEVVRSTSTNH